jgi:hypothetical protein
VETYDELYLNQPQRGWTEGWEKNLGSVLGPREFFMTVYLGNTHTLMDVNKETPAKDGQHKFTFFLRTAGNCIIEHVQFVMVWSSPDYSLASTCHAQFIG